MHSPTGCVRPGRQLPIRVMQKTVEHSPQRVHPLQISYFFIINYFFGLNDTCFQKDQRERHHNFPDCDFQIWVPSDTLYLEVGLY